MDSIHNFSNSQYTHSLLRSEENPDENFRSYTEVLSDGIKTVGNIAYKLAIPVIIIAAASMIPSSEAGPISYGACVTACTATCTPVAFPACIQGCIPLLSPFCP